MSSSSGSDRRSEPLRLVLATANPDKAAEVTRILQEFRDLSILPRPSDVPDVEETGSSLVENARLKAKALCEATDLAAVADDTGLEVEALDGRPGVFSARYAGEGATYADNVKKLLEDLRAVVPAAADGEEGAHRRAAFKTVALVVFPDGSEVWEEGIVTGTIAPIARGEGGFGYDPVFIPDEGDGRTFAEMGADEKHAVSHRGRAFRALAARLTSHKYAG